MVLLNNIINKGFDGGLLIGGLAKHVRNVLMAKDEATLPLLEVSQQQRERYRQQAKKCDTRFLFQALRLMNQCDINYRQAGNKRLLVELTLIEVAQITQPEDSPALGRSPMRLKTLFKKLVQQAQPVKTAPQVAVGQPVKPSPAPITSGRPTLKKTITFSWNNILNKGRSEEKPQSTDAATQKEKKEFSDSELQFQWLSMCNRMPQKHIGIATRMKNMTPHISTFPAIELQVENALVKEQIDQIYGSILNTLKLHLHNSDITLQVTVLKHDSPVRILNRREKYELMEKENPSVAKLREMFDLQLA